ncbi:Protein patched 1 [Desmophyllum pertusum]|uniref:Protein patched 1 n=1 Tax=Desmophyllum pertusum TaxID=174260 RepID=A0A9W9Z0B7_9CNID|nr:Protein patched 1 [Desmophyllum pertusum]
MSALTPSQDSGATSSGTDPSVNSKCAPLSLQHFATAYYGPYLQKAPVKVVVIVFFLALLAVGIYGAFQVEDGLELTDVVPRDSVVHKFVEAQFKYFSFYPMALVTQEDFDYANRQKTLYSYHEEFKEIPNVIRIPDSEEIPKFWMMYFRDWLNDTQTSFDQDWANEFITFAGWNESASSTGVIAYKLLSQKDNTDVIDKSKVRSYKLVSDDGIIRPEIFYKALTIWVDRDVLGYAFSQANIKPETVDWSNDRTSQDDKAMKAFVLCSKRKEVSMLHFVGICNVLKCFVSSCSFQFLLLSQSRSPKINFNIIGLRETKDFVKLIKDVREISDKYSEDGLPNYPSGVPFTFWEQYIWLGRQILIAISISLAVSFLAMAGMLFNLWAAAIIVFVLLMITVEVYGFMGLAGIKLSAVPAVTLILSVGVGVEFTVHMCMAFLHAHGDRNQRMQKAIEHVFVPIVDGAISTFLGVVMLAGSEFEFIVRYFFNLLVALILIGSLNGLVFLPVLLSLAGPGAVATEIPTPSPSNSLTIQNQTTDHSSAESAINVMELEESELYGHGSSLERTYQNIKHGAQVEPSDNEPRSADMTTGKEPGARVHDIKL